MPDNLNNLVKQAKKAYRKGKRRKAADLLDQVLKKDFNHQGAWKELHREYGAGRSFSTFQLEFTERYYPDRISYLSDPDRFTPPPSKGKRSWFRRIFSPLSRNSNESDAGETLAETVATVSNPQVIAPEPVQPRSPGTGTKPLELSEPEKPQFASSQTAKSTAAISAADGSRTPAVTDSDENTIRVMVVDDIQQTRENVIRSLKFQPQIEIVATASNGEQAIKYARNTKPDVVLMDVNMPDMDGITATTGVKKAVPFTQVIILTVQDDVDYMRKAMLAGARDFLTKPPMIDDLIQAVEGAAAIARTEKSKTIQASRIARTAAYPVARRGYMITVYGPKGGVGCTTIASNLAVALVDDESSVVLVDADLLYGDVAVYFNEHSVNTLADLAPRAQDLDPEVVGDVLISHSSGVKLLSAPRPVDAEEINPEQFSDLIKYLRTMFTYVVIDTSTKLSDITIAALDASDLLVLITGHGIPDISRTQKFLELLPLLNFDPENTVVVMNQYDKRINISPEKVAKSFNKEISVVLPKEDRIVIPSVNRGEPFMLRGGIKSRRIGQAMRSLASLVRKRIKALAEKPEPVGY